jgi:hypothetical protein
MAGEGGAADLFDDLKEVLAKLETLMATRWRKISQLTRMIPVIWETTVTKVWPAMCPEKRSLLSRR